MRIDRLLLLLAALGLSTACVTVGEQTDEEAASNVNTELGWGYLQQGDFETASEKLEKALRYNPKNPKANYLYGALQEQLGQNDLAERYYKTAIRLDPKNSSGAYAYGRFLCRNQREAESEKYFRIAVEDPFYKIPEFTLTTAAICMMQIDENDKAREYLRRALSARSDFGPALFNMAKLNFDGGEFDQARTNVDRFHEVSRPTAQSLWLAIRARLETDSNGDLAELAQQLEQEFPDSGEYQEWLKIR